jgi:hypothetical protein
MQFIGGKEKKLMRSTVTRPEIEPVLLDNFNGAMALRVCANHPPRVFFFVAFGAKYISLQHTTKKKTPKLGRYDSSRN